MSQHTPGPWIVEKDERTQCLRVKACGPHVIAFPAQINGDPTDLLYGEVIKANGNLIAAAPELLEACKYAAMVIRNQHTNGTIPASLKMLNAAIAKAEGRADGK